MGFTRAELEAFRDATVPDLVGPGLKLLFVGINPGLWTAATSTHFAHPGNRFYPALRLAGVIERDIDRGVGMSDADRAHLIARGIGITNVVARATAQGVRAVRRRAARRRRAAAGVRARAHAARRGRRRHHRLPRRVRRSPRRDSAGSRDAFEGAELWIVPNPSGLNAHETIASLAAAYRAPAVAAGVVDGRAA